jgi:integrase
MATSHSFSDLAQVVIAAYTGRDPSFPKRLQFWIEHFAHRNVIELKTDDIEDGVDALIQRGKRRARTTRDPKKPAKGISTVVTTGEQLSPTTINRYVATLGTMFKDLRRMRLLPRGFVNPIRGVQRQPEGPGRTLNVTVDDVMRLIAACRVSRNRKLAAMTSLACTTGWRRGSIENLRWIDLNLDAGTADTQRTKNGTPHRTVLLPWVVKELKNIRPMNPEPGELVFGHSTFKKAWKTALERADLPTEWTFHHCRHIAASVLAQSGASVVTIMQCLNHKTPMMALRYSHLNIDSMRDSLGKAWA